MDRNGVVTTYCGSLSTRSCVRRLHERADDPKAQSLASAYVQLARATARTKRGRRRTHSRRENVVTGANGERETSCGGRSALGNQPTVPLKRQNNAAFGVHIGPPPWKWGRWR